MSGVGYLAVGFAAVWLLIAAYLVWLGHKQRLIQKRLDELGDGASREDDA